MRTLECLNAPGLTPPAGHYSHAVVHGGIAYLAGQLPHVPGQPDRKPGTIEEQARQVLSNVDQCSRPAARGATGCCAAPSTSPTSPTGPR